MKLGKKCDFILTLSDYSTLPPFPLPRLPIGSLRSQIFFSPTPVFSPFSPNAEPGPRLLGFWLVILQNCSKFFCYNLLASSSYSHVHHICYKLSCMSGQTLCIYFPGKERGSKEVSVCFSIVVKVAFLLLYFWRDTHSTLSQQTPL